jgi:hypothetical protein
VDPELVSHHLESRGRTAHLARHRVGADLGPAARGQLAGDRVRELPHPARDAGEHRGSRSVGDRDLGPGEQVEQLRHRRPCGDLPRVTGVDPAEQGLDEAVDHLVAVSLADELPDRDVAVGPGHDLLSRAEHALRRKDPALLELVEVERRSHQGAWQRPQRPAGPDPRGGEGRVGDRQADRGRELDALGAPVDHRLGADVDGDPGDLTAAELAADPVRALEDQHVVTGGDQVAGSRQPADPATHHDEPPHRSSVSDGRRT